MNIGASVVEWLVSPMICTRHNTGTIVTTNQLGLAKMLHSNLFELSFLDPRRCRFVSHWGVEFCHVSKLTRMLVDDLLFNRCVRPCLTYCPGAPGVFIHQ